MRKHFFLHNVGMELTLFIMHWYVVFSLQAQKCNGCQSDNDDNDVPDSIKKGWSNEDRLLVSPCTGLVKVSVSRILS